MIENPFAKPSPGRKTDAELKAAGSWRGPAREKARREWARYKRARSRTIDEPEIFDPAEVILELPGYDPHRDAAGFEFRPEAAVASIEWIHRHVTHTKGEKAAGPDPFALARWEQAFLANLYGWYREGTEFRRYVEAFLGVARGNGKTSLAAALLTYFGFNEPDHGMELFSAAADATQSRLIHEQAAQMIRQDAELSRRSRLFHSSIEYDDRKAVYRSLSSEASTKHGLNASLVIVDELHAHKGRDLVDVLVTSTGKRRNPLIIYITTSDVDKPSVCCEKWDHARRVRDGKGFTDPGFLPAIFEADVEDDWTDPAIWAKANPNLEGLHKDWSVPIRYLERECKKAQEIPAYESVFRRLHCNVRCQAETKLISLPDFDRNSGEGITAGPYHLGVDLSSTEDLSAVVGYWPETGAVRCRFFIPEEGAVLREKRDRVPYVAWIRQGFVETTRGNRIDYDVIRQRIREDRESFGAPVDVGIDPWQSAHLMNDLDADGFEVVSFPQGFREYNVPTKEALRLMATTKLAHGGNPVLRYCCGNVSAVTDSHGRIRPSKSSSIARIDGFVALVMAIGRSMDVHGEAGSVYDEGELFVL